MSRRDGVVAVVAEENDRTATAARPRPAAQDAVTVALGTWMVLGVFADGWSHLNQPQLESFFTPAHGVLYSGFAVTAAWMGYLGRHRSERQGWRGRWPTGYGLAAVGVVIFALGAVGDLLWHTVFGVEEALDALTSPTHLLLFTGGVLLLSAPARRSWADHDHQERARATELISLALVASVIVFFAMFASPFVHPGATEPLTSIPENAPGHYAAEVRAMAALASYLLTTAIITGVWLLAVARRRAPVGSFTIIAAPAMLLSASLTSFAMAGSAFGAVVGAVLADVGVTWLDRRRGVAAAGRLPLAAGLAAALLWSGQLAGLALTHGIAWPPELWAGAVMLSAGTGAGLGVVATRGAVRQAAG